MVMNTMRESKSVSSIVFYGSCGESRFSAEPLWLSRAIEDFVIWYDDSKELVMVGTTAVHPGDLITNNKGVISVERR